MFFLSFAKRIFFQTVSHHTLNFFQPSLVLTVTAALHPPPAFNLFAKIAKSLYRFHFITHYLLLHFCTHAASHHPLAFNLLPRREQNRTEISLSSMFDMHIAVKRKTITRDKKINYSKKQTNINRYTEQKYYRTITIIKNY